MADGVFGHVDDQHDRAMFARGVKEGKRAAQPTWVPYPATAPDGHGESCLVWGPVIGCALAEYHTNEGWIARDGHRFRPGPITHWMPLPAPPTPEKKP